MKFNFSKNYLIFGILIILGISGIRCVIHYWDWINQNSGGIQALSTLLLVIFTGIYIKLLYSSLQEARREKEKPRIQELTNVIILPLIKKLETQIKMLGRKDIGYRRYKGEGFTDIQKLISFQETERLIYEDFKKIYPSLCEDMAKHDEKIQELLENANKLAEVIESLPDFISKLNKRGSEFNFSESEKRYVISWIINDKKILEKGSSYEKFWEKYSKEFLDFKNRPEVKETREKFDQSIKELLNLSQNILRELKQIRENFSENYGIKIL